jgi:glycolate oxidase FAD binding subunit
VPMGERATLGGVFACNTLGPSRLRYGAARDLVLGLQAALTSGEVIDVGGKTMKNVAGYDLSKLFVGSFGTLGVITRVTCRLLPRPATSQTLVAAFPESDIAFGLAAKILDSKLLPTRLDVMQGDVWTAHPGVAASLIVGIDGSPESVARQAREIADLALAAGAVRAESLDSKVAEELGRTVRDLPATSEAPMVVRAGLPLAAVASFWVAAERLAASREFPMTLLGRAGLGSVYVMVKAAPAELVGMAEALRGLAAGMGGYMVVERLPASMKSRIDVWGPSAESLMLMEPLKAKFDPKRVLNPGRFVGRL